MNRERLKQTMSKAVKKARKLNATIRKRSVLALLLCLTTVLTIISVKYSLNNKNNVKFIIEENGTITTVNTSKTENSSFLVSINDISESMVCFVEKGTVGELLKSEGIILNDNDYISSNPGDPLKPNLQINLFRVEYKEYKVKEKIPYGQVTKYSSYLSKIGKLPSGSPGKDGIKEITYRQKIVNGEVVETKETNKEIIKKPVDQIVFRDYENPYIMPDVKDLSYKKVVTISRSTAYTNDQTSLGHMTAIGCKTGVGVVAIGYNKNGTNANPHLKLGDWVYIESADGHYKYGYGYICDTSRNSNGDWVDLYFSSYLDCMAWGNRRSVKIYVLDEPPACASSLIKKVR